MNDFKEGKTTLPYIYLYENLQEQDRIYLQTLFKKDLNENEKEWLKTKFEEQKALEKAILEAKTYAKKARKAIEKYDNNKLNDIIKAMIDRILMYYCISFTHKNTDIALREKLSFSNEAKK